MSVQIFHKAIHVVTSIFLLVSTSHAALVGRLPATPGGTDYQAYYDTILGITWIANANLAASNTFGLSTGVSLGTYPSDSSGVSGTIDPGGAMNWPGALFWIDAMNTAGYLGVDGWRLPTVSPVNGSSFDTSFSNNGTTDSGYAGSAGWVDGSGTPVSEMGHMYYNTLGNLGICTPDGSGSSTSCDTQPGWGLNNTGPFTNLIASVYWTGQELPSDMTKAWTFGFGGGDQVAPVKSLLRFAWAVHDGDVLSAVPLPPAVWLFCSGLLGLSGIVSRRKRVSLQQHFQ